MSVLNSAAAVGAARASDSSGGRDCDGGSSNIAANLEQCSDGAVKDVSGGDGFDAAIKAVLAGECDASSDGSLSAFGDKDGVFESSFFAGFGGDEGVVLEGAEQSSAAGAANFAGAGADDFDEAVLASIAGRGDASSDGSLSAFGGEDGNFDPDGFFGRSSARETQFF